MKIKNNNYIHIKNFWSLKKASNFWPDVFMILPTLKTTKIYFGSGRKGSKIMRSAYTAGQA